MKSWQNKADATMLHLEETKVEKDDYVRFEERVYKKLDEILSKL